MVLTFLTKTGFATIVPAYAGKREQSRMHAHGALHLRIRNTTVAGAALLYR